MTDSKDEFTIDFDLKDESWLQDEHPDPALSLSIIQSHNLEQYIRAKIKDITTIKTQTKEKNKQEKDVKERWQITVGAKKDLINLADIIVKHIIDHILRECLEVLRLMQKKTLSYAIIHYVLNKVQSPRLNFVDGVFKNKTKGLQKEHEKGSQRNIG